MTPDRAPEPTAGRARGRPGIDRLLVIPAAAAVGAIAVYIMVAIAGSLLRTHPPPEAALPTLRAATDPAAEGGQYYGPAGRLEVSGPPVVVTSSAASHDRETARRLWELSIELTGVDPEI